ncbi:probable ubiquitin-conjugating enzyme protein 17 [Ptychodera flava]|uniref:probable ubiquitin-conjugating enzyme protein 17 n=1 Tax=Ptychodera flava TaxID=63121 RepID=UPI00396A32D2
MYRQGNNRGSSYPSHGYGRRGGYRQGNYHATYKRDGHSQDNYQAAGYHRRGGHWRGGYRQGNYRATGHHGNSASVQKALTNIRRHLRKLAWVSKTQPRTKCNKSSGVPESTQIHQAPDVGNNSTTQFQAKKQKKFPKKPNGSKYWSKGVGYGHSQLSDWNVPAHMRYQKEKDRRIESALNGTLSSIREFLQNHGTTGGTRQKVADPIFGLYRILKGSVLVPFLEKYLKDVTFLDINGQKMIYGYILVIIKEIAAQPKLVVLLYALPHQQQSVYEHLEALEGEAKTILECTGKGATGGRQTDSQTTTSSEKRTADTISLSEILVPSENAGETTPSLRCLDDQTAGEILARAFLEVLETLTRADSIHGKKRVATPKVKVDQTYKAMVECTSDQESLEVRYKKELQDLQFQSCEIPMSGPQAHRYASSDGNGRLDSRLMFRLAQEYASLSSSLPLHLSSAIFVRTDDSKMNLMQALIVGPEDTPYSGGCYLFDIFFPHNYPSVPPQVHLQTTGGGAVRFNPNLYNCGKVCLSLLGTWSGQGGETWTELSTVLQLLVSIQSLILVSEPYFNEPGYESQIGTDHGQQNSQSYNQGVRVNNIKYAILSQLRNPSPAFEGVIKTHFRLKREKILQEAETWLQSTPNDGQLREQIDNLREELKKLPV